MSVRQQLLESLCLKMSSGSCPASLHYPLLIKVVGLDTSPSIPHFIMNFSGTVSISCVRFSMQFPSTPSLRPRQEVLPEEIRNCIVCSVAILVSSSTDATKSRYVNIVRRSQPGVRRHRPALVVPLRLGHCGEKTPWKTVYGFLVFRGPQVV